jgi:hypothetical protein
MLLPADPTQVPFFGTIDRYLPASSPQEDDQMYHVTYDDGDGEEYFEHELQAALDLYDKFKGARHNAAYRAALAAAAWAPRFGKAASKAVKKRPWTDEHPSVGAKVCKYFAGDMCGGGGPTSDSSSAEEDADAEELRSGMLDFEVKFEENDNGVYDPEAEVPTDYTPAQLDFLPPGVKIALPAKPAGLARNGLPKPPIPASMAAAAKAQKTQNAKKKPSTSTVSKPAAAVSTSSSTSRTGRRTTILLEEAPDAQKARLHNYREGQVATKRQLLGNKTSAGSSEGVNSSSSSSSAPIRKRAKLADEVEVLEVAKKANRRTGKSPVVARGSSASSSSNGSGSSSGSSSSSAGSVTVPPPPLLPASACVNAVNCDVVKFIDECLGVMQQHTETISAARCSVLAAHGPTPHNFCHQLVESMAADIINIITKTLPPTELTKENP